ncbi:MAG: T9SS type A sorting domain-containing protein [Bacteroidia bacterium]|nr:T9SS type A sorting domain-containing protein [Bacteroidia bacterium]
MKILIFLLLIISVNCLGQSSISFVDTNATWNVAKTFPAATQQYPDFVSTLTKIYGYKGDTLINGVLWSKMYFTPDSDFSASSNLTKAGYLRTANNLVFYMDTLFNQDTIYNFNLHSGDSVKYDIGEAYSYLFVTNLDSIIIDGNYHKRFFFSEPIMGFSILKEIWIEGIGSVHGPLFPANPVLFSTEIPDSLFLTCYKINDTVFWNNQNYNDCYINIVLSIHEFRETSGNIFLFPNPFSTETTLQTDKFLNDATLTIYNSTGQQVKQINNISGQTITLHRDNLPCGLYFIRLMQDNKIFKTIKCVIAEN